MEQYQKILATLLLTDIIKCLPTKEKLALRLVNKDFEDAARYALERGEVTFDLSDVGLNNFIETFNIQNCLLPKACIKVQLTPSYPQRFLERFGRTFGAEIVHLQIDIQGSRANQNLASRFKGLLNCCVNLRKLKSGWRLLRFLEVEPTTVSEEVTEVSALENLKDVEFSIFHTEIDLIHEILRASTVRTMSLQIQRGENEGVTSPTVNPDFLTTVTSVPNLTLLDVSIPLPHPLVGQGLFRALVTSDVRPKELVVRFVVGSETEMGEAEKLAFRDWLTKLTSTLTLKKLVFSSNSSVGTQISIPSRMKYVETLDVGTPLSLDRAFVSGHVTLNQRLSPAQIPSVKTVIQTTADETLVHSDVYGEVKTLIAGPKCLTPNNGINLEVVSSPNSTCWPTMFPNLTTLGLAVSENLEILHPIFTRMTYLIHLKIKFVYPFGTAPDNDRLWDMFTGSHRPVLTLTSPLFEVISTLTPSTDQPMAEIQPGVSAICNFRGLKTLELTNVPSAIYLAMVQLTSSNKLVQLDSLKVIMRREYPLPLNSYYDCLKNYHKVVDVSQLE